MIETVLKKYEQDAFGKRVLFYPASKPSRLVVLFTGANRGLYSMWSWFYRHDEGWTDTSYLFLNEDTDPKRYWWYLKEEDVYRNIIQHYMEISGLRGEDVYAIGTSMGGYAALYYGISLGFSGVISWRPQVAYETAAQGFACSHLKDLWVDLDEHVLKHASRLPLIYLSYPDYAPDVAAFQRLVEVLKNVKAMTVVHPHGGKTHVSWWPTKCLVQAVLDFFRSLSGVPLRCYDDE